MIPDSAIIFTDGSSRGNPGPGGFGAIVIAPKNYELGIMNYEVKEIGGREEHTTNNRMELRAAIEALSLLSNVKGQMSIVVFSDSSYVINGITKWIFGWQKNNWITSTKTPVENRDLWKKLAEETKDKNIDWKQIGGHAGVAGNERCDEIATAFADGLSPKLFSGPMLRYPIKNILDIQEDSSVAAAKGTQKNHSRAKAYSYVSFVGGKIEIHKTWAECAARVKGQSGARYKKSVSADDEKEIIAEFSTK